MCTLDTETSFRFPSGGRGERKLRVGEGWGLTDAGLDSLTLMSQTPHVWGGQRVFARLDGKFSKKFHDRDREKKSEIPVQQQEF